MALLSPKFQLTFFCLWIPYIFIRVDWKIVGDYFRATCRLLCD